MRLIPGMAFVNRKDHAWTCLQLSIVEVPQAAYITLLDATDFDH
jgi:hypothetical protein